MPEKNKHKATMLPLSSLVFNVYNFLLFQSAKLFQDLQNSNLAPTDSFNGQLPLVSLQEQIYS